MYARTRAGKTTQIGVLAEHIYRTSGKTTRVYIIDRGGYDPIMPYVDLGIIDVVEQGTSDPWVFLHNAVRGRVRDSNGRWVEGDNTNIGLMAFESMTAFADALMNSMAQKAAQNINIGGGSNISFDVEGDGMKLKVSGNNMAHYGVCQNRITEEVWQSQKLPVDFIVWTASVSKDDDTTGSNKVLGPQVIGKALTAEVPRWFQFTFRLDAIAPQMGKPERHILYMSNHVDVAAGNATGLANSRVPLDAPDIPTTVEPASIVQALALIESGYNTALEKIRSRTTPVKSSSTTTKG